MQQLWHYRPQTCSRDKKQFLSTQIIRKYHSYPLTSMEHNGHKYVPQKMKLTTKVVILYGP